MICHRDIKPENLLVIDMLHSKVKHLILELNKHYCIEGLQWFWAPTGTLEEAIWDLGSIQAS